MSLGWQLGSKPEIQVATSTNNHLVNAIMKYFGDSFRYAPAITLFEKLYQKDPEVAALLAQSYIGQNEEIKAVNILYEALKLAPQSYSLLHAQIDFLRSKVNRIYGQPFSNCICVNFHVSGQI